MLHPQLTSFGSVGDAVSLKVLYKFVLISYMNNYAPNKCYLEIRLNS